MAQGRDHVPACGRCVPRDRADMRLCDLLHLPGWAGRRSRHRASRPPDLLDREAEIARPPDEGQIMHVAGVGNRDSCLSRRAAGASRPMLSLMADSSWRSRPSASLLRRCASASSRRFPAPQQQGIRDHADTREGHGGTGDDRVEQAECRERNAAGIVDEGPEQVLLDLGAGCAATRQRASATASGSERISVIPAASMATSVPEPMAMPRSAAASAGASLTPSPTMAIAPWIARSSVDDARLVLRRHLGTDFVDADLPGDGAGGGFDCRR